VFIWVLSRELTLTSGGGSSLINSATWKAKMQPHKENRTVLEN